MRASVVGTGGELRLCDKSGHTHASRDIPLFLKVERDGVRGSNGQLFTRCLPIYIDKNLRDMKAGEAWSDAKIRGEKREKMTLKLPCVLVHFNSFLC